MNASDNTFFDLRNKDYESVTSRLIMSQDLNAVHTLFGGRLIQWVDEAAAIYVMALLKSPMVVTKKISEVIYNNPARLGDVLEFFFKVKHSGKTSITIQCVVITKVISRGSNSKLILNCDVVFVKVNSSGQPEEHGFQS